MSKKRLDREEVKVFKNGEIWWYGRGFYKVYTALPEIKKHFMKVNYAVLANRYFSPNGWDFIFKSKKLAAVKKILGGRAQIIDKEK